MALSKLSDDLIFIIFSKLCNVLHMGDAVAFSSASSELRALTRLEVAAAHVAWLEVAARRAGKRSYKKLSHAKSLQCIRTGVSADDLATLGTLCSIGSMLPALQDLRLIEPAADGVQRLAEKLGADALPALSVLRLGGLHVGDAGASALAAALGRGALPRLKTLQLNDAAIGDEGLVALAPALRRLPALESGCPRWRLSISLATRSATWASRPSWNHRRRQVRRRRRLERWRSSRCSTWATPGSPTPGAPPSSLRSTAARYWRSRSSVCMAVVCYEAPLPVTQRGLPSSNACPR